MTNHLNKYSAVTTFHLPKHLYGIEMINSFYANWPNEITLTAFVENSSEIDDSTVKPKIIIKDFDKTVPEYQKFVRKYKEKEKSKRSLARCQSVLRNYFRFLSERNNWKNHSFNKISTTKYDKRISNKTFKEEDLINFLKFIDPDQSKSVKNSNSWQHRRDIAVIYFIYSTGLRVSEVLQFKFSDTPFNDQIKVIGKGKKERYIPILPIIKEKVSKYIEVLKASTKIEILNNDPLFIKINSQNKSSLTSRDIQRSMKKLIEIYPGKIPSEATPHSLRHSFASHLLQNGINIRKIQKLLGHESIDTTQIYTNLDDDYLKKEYDKVQN